MSTKNVCPVCGFIDFDGGGHPWSGQQTPPKTRWCIGRVQVVHGLDCRKSAHVRPGHLHGENDDGPYDVDGVDYCGRCHAVLP